jgi:hypothetical protein
LSDTPPGQPIVLTPPAGPFTFRIYAREGSGTPETNPRLDCICFAEEPDYVPTEADARDGLK